MVKLESLVSLLLAILVVGWLGSPVALEAQTSYTQMNTTNACIGTTFKLFNPNMTSPTVQVIVAKILTATRLCNTVTMSNAFCNPGSVAANTMTLYASAMGTQITMMPSCQWACGGCSNIITNSTVDSLPVELMGFDIEEEAPSPESVESESRQDGGDFGSR